MDKELTREQLKQEFGRRLRSAVEGLNIKDHDFKIFQTGSAALNADSINLDQDDGGK